MRKLILIMLQVSISSLAHASADLPVDYRAKTFPVESPLVLDYAFGPGKLNRATLNVVNYPGGQSDLFFFHMHINETTSKMAGEEMVRKNGGTFMYLNHFSGGRDMVVQIGKTKYTFDPNRIFTAFGLAEKTQPKPTPADLVELQKFVDWLKRNILLGLAQRARPMVTALHNNTDDDVHGELLSILTEEKLLKIDNAKVHINKTWDIDNFYIATLETTYDELMAKSQPNISRRLAQPRDIGYLSNWMIRDGIEYLNVETQIGDFNSNLNMVDTIQAEFH